MKISGYAFGLAIICLILCCPAIGQTKDKVEKGKTFHERVELKKKEIKKKRIAKGPPPKFPLQVTVTGAVIGKQLHTSALGYKIKPGQCAVSQDLIDSLGKNLKIGEACGKFKGKKLAPVGNVKAACVMPNKWRKRIDVYVTSKQQAYAITGTRLLTVTQ